MNKLIKILLIISSVIFINCVLYILLLTFNAPNRFQFFLKPTTYLDAGTKNVIQRLTNGTKKVFHLANKNVTTKIHHQNDSAIFQPYLCTTKFTISNTLILKEKYDEKTIRRHPNLATFIVYSKHYSSSIPNIASIRWTGTVFQESWEQSPKFLLYSAHFDTRMSSGLLVRILGLYDGKNEPNKTEIYCQIWFKENENPLMTPVDNIILIFYAGWTNFRNRPYGITCKMPTFQNSSRAPIAVAVVNRRCETPTNFLKIFGSSLPKAKIPKEQMLRRNLTVGVCSKALFYYNMDFSSRLIEWIEIMRALGASQVFLYKMPCHENITKVLDYYEKTGFVKLIQFNYPPPYIQDGTFVRLWTASQLVRGWSAQSMYINDCLLRNKDNFDYLLVCDPDEVPVLKQHRTLQELIKYVMKNKKGKNISSISLQWKDFYGELKPGVQGQKISKKYYNLHHTRRGKLYTKTTGLEQNVKTIYNTNYLALSGCHSAFSIISDPGTKTEGYLFNRSVAYTGHWGSRVCTDNFCNESVLEEEEALLKYKDAVIKNVDNTFKNVYKN